MSDKQQPQPSFTYEKVQELLNLPEEQREEVLDKIVIRYMDDLTAKLDKLNTEGGLKPTLQFFNNFMKVEIWNMAWVLTFACKPTHRKRMANLWKGIGNLYDKHKKK